MRDDNKTKEQLIDELLELRRKIAATEMSDKNSRCAGAEGIDINKLYETILEGTSIGVWVTDKDDVIRYANKGMGVIAGVLTEQIVGARVLQDFSEDTLKFFRPHYLKTQETLKRQHYTDVPVVTPSGRQSYQSGWLIPIVKDSSFNGMICTVEDVTDFTQTIEALRLQGQMIDNMAEGTALVRISDATIVDNNARFEEIFGYNPGELVRVNVSILNAPTTDGKSSEEVHMDIVEVLNKDGMWSGEVRNIKKDGTIFWCRANVTTFKSRQYGDVWLVVMEDITERKQAEEDRLRTQKLESVGVLAGGISHDFNNLLTGVIGNLSLLKHMVDKNGNAYKRLIEVEKAATQARGLTQQLLAFSKGGRPVKETMPIGSLIQECAVFALRGTNVRCDCSIPKGLWCADVDWGQVSQAINNLAINAVQAMPEGGVLKVSAQNRTVTEKEKPPLKEGRYVRLSIEDHGAGIPEKLISKIFDPYFTTKQKGSGLGLASSYSIVKKHGGHIEVSSKVGVGTSFRVYLPASEEDAVVKTKAEAEVPISAGGRILVMDDEEIVRDVATAILTTIGYEVKTATEGSEAIRLYKDARDRGEPFDAVIIDLTIPGGMGGKEAIKCLLEYDSEVKAIVSSGYSNDPVLADYKKHGFSGVIVKPYKASELVAKAHHVITQKD